MDLRDLQLNFGANAVLVNSSRNVAVGTHNCGDFGGSAPSASRHTDAYSDFEVQDLSYSAQCLPMDLGSSVDPHAVHDDQDVSCIDLSLLLSSSKACDRQQIEDELPLNLTGKAREEEINRRLRQCQQFNYQFSSYSDPPRNVFLAPDFLGFHELQDLRTHTYLDDAVTADLSYCPQTLDLSAQSLDLSLTQDERLDTFARQDLSYDPQRSGAGGGETGAAGGDFQQPLPPASSLPLPLSISRTLTSTLCLTPSQQYAALDLRENPVQQAAAQEEAVQQVTATSATVPDTSSYRKEQEEPVLAADQPEEEGKRYACAECGAEFGWTQQLEAHRQLHRLAKPLACDQCPARFGRAGALHRHQRNTHGNHRPFACPACPKRFSQRHDLHRHRRTHAQPSNTSCP